MFVVIYDIFILFVSSGHTQIYRRVRRHRKIAVSDWYYFVDCNDCISMWYSGSAEVSKGPGGVLRADGPTPPAGRPQARTGQHAAAGDQETLTVSQKNFYLGAQWSGAHLERRHRNVGILIIGNEETLKLYRKTLRWWKLGNAEVV